MPDMGGFQIPNIPGRVGRRVDRTVFRGRMYEVGEAGQIFQPQDGPIIDDEIAGRTVLDCGDVPRSPYDIHQCACGALMCPQHVFRCQACWFTFGVCCKKQISIEVDGVATPMIVCPPCKDELTTHIIVKLVRAGFRAGRKFLFNEER